MMRYVHFEDGCSPDEMSIEEGAIPQIASDELLIKVAAFGINRADTLQRQGKYPPPKGESCILGLEVSGEVVDKGAACSLFENGAKVIALVPGGGYAEYVAVKETHAIPLPEGMLMTDGAGVIEVYLTAYQALFALGHLSSDERVLIHAGASGVGLAACQLASRIGAEVIVTASNDAKLDACKAAGASTCINYKQEDFAEVLREQKKSVDVVVDVVGGDYFNKNLRVLSVDGRIIYLAMLGGRYVDKLDMALLLGKRARVQGSTLRNRSDIYKAELIASFAKDCLAGFSQGTLKPNIYNVFAVEDTGIAHRHLEQNESIGKFVVTW